MQFEGPYELLCCRVIPAFVHRSLAHFRGTSAAVSPLYSKIEVRPVVHGEPSKLLVPGGKLIPAVSPAWDFDLQNIDAVQPRNPGFDGRSFNSIPRFNIWDLKCARYTW